ncbi:MAG TPA: hypothetical protein VGA84_01880 [Thermoanaerobaculia bacterium]
MKRALVLIALLSLPAIVVAAVSERPSAVEVVNPIAPQPVIADGREILAYELHITNFGKAPLVLRHLEVFGDGQPFLDLSGNELSWRKASSPSAMRPMPRSWISAGASSPSSGSRNRCILPFLGT